MKFTKNLENLSLKNYTLREQIIISRNKIKQIKEKKEQHMVEVRKKQEIMMAMRTQRQLKDELAAKQKEMRNNPLPNPNLTTEPVGSAFLTAVDPEGQSHYRSKRTLQPP